MKIVSKSRVNKRSPIWRSCLQRFQVTFSQLHTWNEEENVWPGGEIEGLDVEKDFSTWIEKNRDTSKNKKVVIEFLAKCDRVDIERALSGAGILLTRRG